MRIVTPAEADTAWDAMVERCLGGWFWHTQGWLEYQRAYRADNADASFAVVDDDSKLAAVVPLVVSRAADGSREFSFSGNPGPLPLTRTSAARSCVVAEIARRAKSLGVSVARFATRAESECGEKFALAPSALLHNFRSVGSVDIQSASRRVVDLTAPPKWADVRDSYKALIHRAEREYALRVYTDERGFLAYQRLHRQQYESPRADATYRLQVDWLADGRALVVTAEDAGGVWGAAYWFAWKSTAYYGSGAYVARNVSHGIIWRSLAALREMGVTRAVLGAQGVAKTDKERNIEAFKRGFTGFDEPADTAVVTFA